MTYLKSPPLNSGQVAVITRLKTAYQLWQSIIQNIPKIHRHTFGGKIDELFLKTFEILFQAQYAKTAVKSQYLVVAIGKLDLLKFFLQIGWENGLIDIKKYSVLSEALEEIGQMLGGWKKGLETKLSPHNGREKQ